MHVSTGSSSSTPVQAQGPGGAPRNSAFEEWYKAFLQPSPPSSSTRPPRLDFDDPDADYEPDDCEDDGPQAAPQSKRYRPSALDTAVHVSTHAENSASHDRQSRKGRITEEAKLEKLRLHKRWQNIAQQELASARAQPQAIAPLDAAAALADIHPSHNLKLLRNAAFCSTCGYWRIKRARGLRKPCGGTLLEGQASKLTKLNAGLHPDGLPWPDGAPGNIPFRCIAPSTVMGRCT